MADRLFDTELYVFATDFYAQAIAADVKKEFVPSNRFRYRYLFAFLTFVGPQGPLLHLNWCKSAAWSLAQWYRRRNGTFSHICACFGDPHYYRMRSLYFTSFPAMFQVVFAWADEPASRIARCWKRHEAKRHQLPLSAPSTSCAQVAKPKEHPITTIGQPKSPTQATITSTRNVDMIGQKAKYKPPRKQISVDSSRRIARNGTKQQVRETNFVKSSNKARPLRRQHSVLAKELCGNVKVLSVAQKSNESSPTKRRLNHVKQTRTERSSADLAFDLPNVTKVSSDGKETSSLTMINSLRFPESQVLVATCDCELEFVDLDLNKVKEFACLAHYRAQVVTGKNSPVNKSKPPSTTFELLQDLDRAVNLIKTHQQRVIASAKVVVDADSIAHLSEIHIRVILLITTLNQRYIRDFGITSFTRHLRRIIRKLTEWKFTCISEVIAALDDATSIATQEKTQRTLDFFRYKR